MPLANLDNWVVLEAYRISPAVNPVNVVPPFATGTTLPYVVAFPDDVISPVRLAFVVTVAALPVQLADDPVVFWFNVGNVQLVNVPDAGVPNAGVTKVGDVAKTNAPLPVSSEIVPANSADVVAAKSLSLSVVNAVFAL